MNVGRIGIIGNLGFRKIFAIFFIILFGQQMISSQTPTTGSIATGSAHALALKNVGTVWTWGLNEYGQLGNGTTTDNQLPTQISTLTGIVALATGENHSLVLKSDGTVWAWGLNDYGQLGDGTTTTRLTPVGISGLINVTALAAGASHSLLIKSDETVWAWGRNDNGQLGNGTTTSSTIPVQSGSLADITAITAGSEHSMALASDGTVWTWGANAYGQLGNGTTANSTSPIEVTTLSGVTGIAAGSFHSLALKNDGTVWSWGLNTHGQLGNGTTTNQSAPVQVIGLSGVTSIAAGSAHSLALTSFGTVWSWGLNDEGQLGDGTTTNRTTPAQISSLSNVVAIAAKDKHSMALLNDGTVLTWGDDEWGETGDVSLHFTQAAIRLIPWSSDSNQNGINDAWEIKHFGDLSHTGLADADSDGLADILEYQLGTDPTLADTDGDGVSDLAECDAGTSPTDYYNGTLPTITSLVDSSGVPGTDGLVSVRITNASGNVLSNAPVTLSVSTGASEISASVGGTSSTEVTVRTDSNGVAKAYVTFTSLAVDVLTATVTGGGESRSLSINIEPPVSEIEGMKLWLKADAGVTKDSSGYVSVWADQSGNGHDVSQTTSASQPQWVSDATNGQPVIRFDGSNDYLTGVTTSDFKPTNITIMAVYKLTGTSFYPMLICQPKEISGWSFPEAAWALYIGNNGAARPLTQIYNGSTTTYSSGNTDVINRYAVIAMIYDGSVNSLYINGCLQSTQSQNGLITYGPSNVFYMGAAPYGGYLKGDVAELVVYNKALTTEELGVATTYLVSKYAPSGMVAPDTLTTLTAKATLPTQVSLQWVETTANQAITYTIERRTGDGAYMTVAEVSSISSYMDKGLTAGTKYSYRIKSRTYAGSSGYSNVATVTTPNEASVPVDGLLLWLRADAGVSKDSSGYVSKWLDQSGNGRDVSQTTSANQPQWVSDAANGQPVIRFDGSNDYLTGVTTSDFKPTNITVMAVYKLTATGSYPKIICQPYYSSGWSSPWVVWGLSAGYGSNAQPYVDAYIEASGHFSNSGISLLGEYVLLTEVYDGSTVNLYLDGKLFTSNVATGNITYGSSASFYLGADPCGEYLNGDIAEVLVYNKALSKSELNVSGMYLYNKYMFSGYGDSCFTKTVTGTEGADTYSGTDGYSNIMNGLGGNDILNGGSQADTLNGGAGDDYLYGKAGNDTLNGDAGNDYINCGPGDDIANGGIGNDTIYGQEGTDTLYGGDGDDFIDGYTGSDYLNGGAGNDTLGGYGAGNWSSNSSDSGALAGDTFEGGLGDDTIYGTRGPDVYIYNLGDGKDTIYEFGNSADTGIEDELRFVDGITPDSVVVSQNNGGLVFTLSDGGSVKVAGWYGNVNNQLEKVSFKDGTTWDATTLTTKATELLTVHGTDSSDTMTGMDNYPNTLYGGAGNDTLSGGNGDDKLYGEADNDNLYGNDGADTLDGGDGNDTLTGGKGSDTLIGGAGNDTLYGYRNGTIDEGSDVGNTFIGGTGDDKIYGTRGPDVYLYNLGDGADTILEAGNSNDTGVTDELRFGSGITSSTVTVTRSGLYDIVFTLSDGGSVTVLNWFAHDKYKIEKIVFTGETPVVEWTPQNFANLGAGSSEYKDTDGDGLSDAEELTPGTDGYITDPLVADTDGDGIDDSTEAFFKIDPTKDSHLVDSDGDGLSDYEEVTAGSDGYITDPRKADTDGDGLSDYDEYRYHTNPLVADTDGDGLSDGEEVVKGADGYVTNPLLWDTDGDGVSDGAEYANGMDPTHNNSGVDTDGDGVSDIDEVLIFGTKANVDNHFGTQTVLQDINLSTYTNETGLWNSEDGDMVARTSNGSLGYQLDVAEPGIYLLEVDGGQHNAFNTGSYSFLLNIYVDGMYVGDCSLSSSNGSDDNALMVLPKLTAGKHTVKIECSGSSTNSYLKLTGAKLISYNGADFDGDGVADWIEERISNSSSLDANAVSTTVSPYTLEGESKYPEEITIASTYTPEMSTSADLVAHRGLVGKYYANIPLSPDAATTITVNEQRGTATYNKEITWVAYNILDNADTKVRLDDSMKLAAHDSNSTSTDAVSIKVYNKTTNALVASHTQTAADSWTYKFETAGNYDIVGTCTENGADVTQTIEVNVLSVDFGTAPEAIVNSTRNWTFACTSSTVQIEADPTIALSNMSQSGTQRSYSLKASSLTDATIVARLGDNGPIMGSIAVNPIKVESSTVGNWNVVDTLEDGSQLVEVTIALSEIPDDLRINMSMWNGSATFLNGTKSMTITATDFNSSGMYKYYLILPAGAGTHACHNTYIQQGNTVLASF
jgi:alpha-tubulin suppressor-like RCC1 family protein/Ca2+-binding RTX toxin-like protein